MDINLADNLKNLRKEKNVSQEKLANYLNVSFQAVSKWENGNSCPDIAMLPDIARFFGITIDELLQVEKLDEQRMFQEYEEKAAALFRDGKWRECLALTQETYHKIPNNIDIKQHLMAGYYDVDKKKYKDEIINLGMEIYNSNANTYYKGQAVRLIANTYAENGNYDMAENWVQKSYQINHCSSVLYTQIDKGEDLIADISFCTFWFVDELFYMTCRIQDIVERENDYKKEAAQKTAAIYEIIYPDDDMPYESLRNLCQLHAFIAQFDAQANREDSAKEHLLRALACAQKSLNITEHCLTSAMIDKWHIDPTPDNSRQIVHTLRRQMKDPTFDSCRDKDWFVEIENQLAE